MLIKRWNNRESSEKKQVRTEQSFFVSSEEIKSSNYDLSINRYKEIKHEHIDHIPPLKIINELNTFEDEIKINLKKLKHMLK
mgnify:FL=1